MKLRIVLLAAFLGLGALAGPARAEDPKKEKEDPKVAKQRAEEEKKQKEYQKQREALEKELKGKKIDPTQPLAFLDRLYSQVGLELPKAVDLTKKVVAKKIPFEQANQGADEKLREAIDQKTQKIDLKKFVSELTKWINEWKPPAKEEPKKDEPKK